MWKWLTCFLSHGIVDYYDNCYETEAQNFENLITTRGAWDPCTCVPSAPPFAFGIPELNSDSTRGFQAINAAITGDASGGRTKIKSSCSLEDCFGDNLFGYAKGLISLVVSTLTSVAGTFFMEGPVASVTTIIGAAGGLIGGFATGLGYR